MSAEHSHLEWSALCERWAAEVESPLARKRFRGAAPWDHLETDPQRARDRLAEIDALESVVGPGTLPAWGEVEDVAPLLERAERGTALDAEELLTVAVALGAIDQVVSLLGHPSPLRGILERVPATPELTGRLQVSLRREDDGVAVTDAASTALAEARASLGTRRRELLSRAQRLVKEGPWRDRLADEFWTDRLGRVVLPVRTDRHERAQGILHGSSSTGRTLFVEPFDLVELNNDVRGAMVAIRAEERRVLAELTAAVGEAAAGARTGLEALVRLDEIRARWRLGRAMGAHTPRLVAPEDVDVLILPGVRHPLMALDGTNPVPNHVEVPVAGALIISGPNAGGKTVALKCVGLCVLMARAGLRLPTASPATVPLFRRVATDVGDDQSIHSGLSTFTAHLEHLREGVEAATRDGRGTLMLVDEVAAGTDPEQGAALAEALLLELVELGATCAVSTHFARLKLLSDRDARFVNASVGMDASGIRPTYRLHRGRPGASSALIVAERVGFPLAVIRRARALLDAPEHQVEALLEQLELQREQLQVTRQQLEEERASLGRERDDLAVRERNRESGAHGKKMAALREARLELVELQETIRRRRKSLDADTRASVNRDFKALENRVVGHREPEPTPNGTPPESVQVGDVVLVASVDKRGEVESVRGTRALVRVAGLRMTVRHAELRAVPSRATTAPRSAPAPLRNLESDPRRHFGSDARAVEERIDNVVDIRGERAEDALPRVEAFLAESLERHDVVVVRHGFGSGALRRAVRAHLTGLPHVVQHRGGLSPEGGDAVTVVWVRA